MKSNAYIPALTGVRAIAAYLVFFHHFNQEGFPYPLFRIFNEFHMGVTLFFVLSGFLICLRYYDTCEITSDWFRKYIKNRIARIYPMYLVLTIGTFVYAWFAKDSSVYNGFPYPIILILLNVFFLRGFFDGLKFSGLAQGWSLTVEECFYFSAPFFFKKIKKNPKAIYYLPFVVLGIGVLLVFIFRNINFYGFYGNYTFNFLYTFTGRCTEFFIGIFLALYLLKKDNVQRKGPWITMLGVLGMVIGVGIMAMMPLTEERKFGLYHPFGIVANNLILPIGIALLFYGLIAERTWLQRFLSTKTMELLGKASYIYYLVHIGFIATIASGWSKKWVEKMFEYFYNHEIEWITKYDSVLWPVAEIGIVFILLNIVSIILYKTIEEPLNKYIRNSSLLEKRKPKIA